MKNKLSFGIKNNWRCFKQENVCFVVVSKALRLFTDSKNPSSPSKYCITQEIRIISVISSSKDQIFDIQFEGPNSLRGCL